MESVPSPEGAEALGKRNLRVLLLSVVPFIAAAGLLVASAMKDKPVGESPFVPLLETPLSNWWLGTCFLGGLLHLALGINVLSIRSEMPERRDAMLLATLVICVLGLVAWPTVGLLTVWISALMH